MLAYWVVIVIMYSLKLEKHENMRWDEIMRIASTQVVVTAKAEIVDGQVISIKQSTEAQSKLSPPSMICSTLTPNRSGKENPCYTQI